MSGVIFCKTRWHYAPYDDFFRLVELAGYPIIYVDELDAQSDNTYIFTPSNGEMINGWQNPKARIILWQLEWLTDVHTTPPGCVEVWGSDKWQADTHGFKYVPMGSDEQLNQRRFTAIPYLDMDYISLLSYQTYRRQVITQQLRDLGIGISVIDDSWGKDRSRRLLQSRLMVHVHQHDNMPGIAPLRWCLAAAHNLPILTETVRDRGIFGYTYMMQSDYAHIAQDIQQLLNPIYHYKQELEDKARNLHGLLCRDWTFRKCVEANV